MATPGLLVLRLTLAVVFVAHGLHQLFGIGGGPGIGPGGLDHTASVLAAAGLEPGFPLAVLAGVIQLIGGALLAAGFLTRWAALALVAYLALGVWAEHLAWGFFLNWIQEPGRGHGIEYSLVVVGALVCLLLAGAGDWSIDGRRASTAASRAAARERVRRKF